MNKDITYLFHIKSQNGTEYHLTSGINSVTYNGKEYLPYSGLSIASGEFNDSAENHIIIHGIFENKGISSEDQFIGANIQIMYLQSREVKHLVTYICTQYNINDLDFEIRCESESIKYNQSLLQMFSKTCRANFGDNKCKVDISNYIITCKLLSVNTRILTCDISDIDDRRFQGGKVILDSKKEYKILTHNDRYIEIETDLNTDFNECKQVTLIPACDKKFRTCCYSFNNAVNFRGEPDIPESNIVKS